MVTSNGFEICQVLVGLAFSAGVLFIDLCIDNFVLRGIRSTKIFDASISYYILQERVPVTLGIWFPLLVGYTYVVLVKRVYQRGLFTDMMLLGKIMLLRKISLSFLSDSTRFIGRVCDLTVASSLFACNCFPLGAREHSYTLCYVPLGFECVNLVWISIAICVLYNCGNVRSKREGTQ